MSVGFGDRRRCTVDSRRWNDLYSGTVVEDAGVLDIDHMVPLANPTAKANWELTATAAEWAAFEEMLSTCSDGIAIGLEPSAPTTQPEIPTATVSIESRTIGAPIFDPLGPYRDCGEFDMWAQAQDFHEAARGPDTDRHLLD